MIATFYAAMPYQMSFWYGFSQCEKALHSNAASEYLSSYPEWSLYRPCVVRGRLAIPRASVGRILPIIVTLIYLCMGCLAGTLQWWSHVCVAKVIFPTVSRRFYFDTHHKIKSSNNCPSVRWSLYTGMVFLLCTRQHQIWQRFAGSSIDNTGRYCLPPFPRGKMGLWNCLVHPLVRPLVRPRVHPSSPPLHSLLRFFGRSNSATSGTIHTKWS